MGGPPRHPCHVVIMMSQDMVHLSISGGVDDEPYGESAALRYDVFESRPSGYANLAAPRIWSALEGTGAVNEEVRVLDVGCGTGQLAAFFLERGAHVTGLDLSEHMLRYARRNNTGFVESGQASFVQADASNFRLDERFRVATATFNFLNHLADHEAVKGCLASVLRALEPRGQFLFDFNTRRGLENTVERTEISDTEEDITVWIRRFEGDRVVLYATGCFLHAGIWHRYRETIHKIVLEADVVRTILLDQGWSSVVFTEDAFVTPVRDPEAADVAYVVARK